jgi:hypothetical protein
MNISGIEIGHILSAVGILIEPCFFDHSLTMKKVCLVICVLVMFSKMIYVNATGICLTTKEKGYLHRCIKYFYMVLVTFQTVL